MKKNIYFMLLFTFSVIHSLTVGQEYLIDVFYQPESLSFSASQTVNYTNDTGDSLKSLHFHIYGNKDVRMSDVMKNPYFSLAHGQSPINFKMSEINQDGVTVNYTIINQDKTLLQITLNSELKPLQQTQVVMKYEATVPYIQSRYGQFEYLSHFGYWYPILDVYSPGSGWTDHRYSFNGEPFYSDVADYHVKIRVPETEHIIAPGSLQDVAHNWDKTKTETYSAKTRRAFNFTSGLLLEKLTKKLPQGTLLQVYYQPTQRNAANEVLKTAEQAVLFFESIYGTYPYPELSIAPANLLYSGEENPGLILISKALYQSAPNILFGGIFPTIRSLEYVVAHEIAHQWWYASVGNDQYSQPWLDEGLTEYSTMLYLKHFYGEKANLLILPHIWATLQGALSQESIEQNHKRTYIDHVYDFADTVSQNIDSYYAIDDYFKTVYSKGALVLQMFHKMAGNELFYKTMRTYYERYKNKNASIQNFIALAEEVTGKHWRVFFDQWLNSSPAYDSPVGEQVPLNQSAAIAPENITLASDKDNNLSDSSSFLFDIFSLSQLPTDKWSARFQSPILSLSQSESNRFFLSPYAFTIGRYHQFISFISLDNWLYSQKSVQPKGVITLVGLANEAGKLSAIGEYQQYEAIKYSYEEVSNTEMLKRTDIAIKKSFSTPAYDAYINWQLWPHTIKVNYQRNQLAETTLNYSTDWRLMLDDTPVAETSLIWKEIGTATANANGSGIYIRRTGLDWECSMLYLPAMNNNIFTQGSYSQGYIIKKFFLNYLYYFQGTVQYDTIGGWIVEGNHTFTLPLGFNLDFIGGGMDQASYLLLQRYSANTQSLETISRLKINVAAWSLPVIPYQFELNHTTGLFTYGISLVF